MDSWHRMTSVGSEPTFPRNEMFLLSSLSTQAPLNNIAEHKSTLQSYRMMDSPLLERWGLTRAAVQTHRHASMRKLLAYLV